MDFCNLMADCAWFVHDNDAAGVMSLTIGTGYGAYYKLSESSKDRLLEADMLLIVCLKDLRVEGDFKSAEAQGKKSLAIREDMNLPQDLEMTNCYNYIATACDSMGRHEEAKMWLKKSRGILEGHDDELHTRLLCQNNLNFSRSGIIRSRRECSMRPASRPLVSKAGTLSHCKSLHIFCHLLCQAEATEEKLNARNSAHQTKANLYLMWDRRNSADSEVLTARSTLNDSGGFASISWISGIVSCRAASVAIVQSEQTKAIEEAQKAVAIGRLYRMPAGARARFSHLLMTAYLMDPQKYQKEANEARQEAQRLRKLCPPGRTDLDDGSDHAFDMHVDISVR